MLQAVPDIGPVKAAALLREFGNIASICQTSADELAKVSGIGPRTATRLHYVFIYKK
jgi:excinuclease ABC subunit C